MLSSPVTTFRYFNTQWCLEFSRQQIGCACQSFQLGAAMEGKLLHTEKVLAARDSSVCYHSGELTGVEHIPLC